MRKLVLCGSISTGKTTTFNCLRAVFDVLNPLDRSLMDPGPKVHFVGEAAREVFTANPHLDRDSYEADKLIVDRIIFNEKKAGSVKGAQVLVCDRSVVDTLAFSFTHGAHHFEKLFHDPIIQAHIRSYDKFLLFDPTNVPYVEDGVRIEGEDFRSALHKDFQVVLTTLGVNWELLSGPVSTRVSKVLEEVLKLNA